MLSNTTETIFIGKKPLMTYVTSAIIQLSTIPVVTIKARGQSIGPAVDVVQIVLQRTKPAYSVGDVKIGSESLVSSDGKNRNVSTIEIPIKRNAK
ncbi:MAG: DNA-binding protein [Nitrosarchaeum sp.]|nr:DNA-binding protein [Nitrosarchaeum sp.]MCV0399051.1 DNA-binding protein [Nitrosarchaeum sp.]